MGIEDKLPEHRFSTIDLKELRERSKRARAAQASLKIVRVYTKEEMDEIYKERSRAVYAVKLEQELGLGEEPKNQRYES